MDSKARLTASMHLYSQRCDNLGVSSIGGCISLLLEAVRDSKARLPPACTSTATAVITSG